MIISKTVFWLVKIVYIWFLTLGPRNFVHTGPILTILVPMDNGDTELLNGTKMVKFGPL